MNKERIIWLDNLKGFAILLVILGHCIQSRAMFGFYEYLYSIIYSFHMPLFMALSGYCSPNKAVDKISFVKKRFFRLMVPYLVWGVVNIFIYSYPVSTIVSDPDKHLWFLWDLFFISVIVNSLFSFVKNIKAFITCLLITSFSFLAIGKIVPDNILNIKSICWMYQFYVFGIIIKKYKDYIIRNRVTSYMLVFFSSFLLLFFNLYVKDLINDQYLLYGLQFLLAYIGVYLFFLFFIYFANSETSIAKIGQCTLGIYAIHQLLIEFIDIKNVWLLFVVTLLLSLLFVYFVRSTRCLSFLIGESISNTH